MLCPGEQEEEKAADAPAWWNGGGIFVESGTPFTLPPGAIATLAPPLQLALSLHPDSKSTF